MSNQGAQSSGSLHPWLDGEQRFSEVDLVWQDPDHATPFSAMADLIGNWPGSPQTSECPIQERHSRLMQIIAGYPEVYAGRRPLDAPLHPRSRIAFKLSSFIDRIGVPSSYEWHSLRTALLLYDTIKVGEIREKQNNDHHKKILHTMMKHLRMNTKYIDTNNAITGYHEVDPHPDEVKFLTLLHSQHQEPRALWPIAGGDNGVVLNFNDYMFPNDDDTYAFILGKEKSEFKEHEFKFMRIQTWLNRWAQPFNETSPLNPNVSSNLLVGASVMLESTFGKLRSQVIAQHGAGSLIVDGGGRMTYLSQMDVEEQREWFINKLGSVLLLDNEHPHPYQNIIQKSMEDYGKRAKLFIKQHIDNHNEDLTDRKERIEFKNLFHQSGKSQGKPNRQMFEFLLRSEYIVGCMPELSEFTPESDSWEKESCVLCNNLEHQSSKFRAPNDILDAGHYVCVFHYLIFYIGKQAKLRYNSRADVFKQLPQPQQLEKKEVNQIVKFDGNSIGGWFSKPYTGYKAPGPWNDKKKGKKHERNLWLIEKNKDAINDYWMKHKNEILNIGRKDNKDVLSDQALSQIQLEAPEGWGGFESRKLKILRRVFNIQRTQPLLRKQRRSFHFNAVWWSALQENLHQAVPWVLAGDDITLVSSSSEPDVFHNMLTALHHTLMNEFQQTPITFAGGVCTRNDDEKETIFELYKRCSKLEHTAGYLWKFLFADDEAMPDLTDEKRKKLELWLNKEDILEENRDQVRSKIRQQRYAIGANGGINSLLLHSDWDVDSQNKES